MKLMEIALGKKPKKGSDDDEGEESGGLAEDAIEEAFEYLKKGKTSKAARSMKAAIEACVSEYSGEDY